MKQYVYTVNSQCVYYLLDDLMCVCVCVCVCVTASIKYSAYTIVVSGRMNDRANE